MRFIPITAITLLAASTLFADATVEQKTQVHFGGAMSVVNVFGGKATHDGADSTVVIKGDRKSSHTGSTGEIIDLGEEKIYRLDYDRKTYKVTTFEELRKQLEEQRARAGKSSKETKKNEGPELEVEFDVKSTGRKETINGWATHEEVVTVTVHEKGKKIEQSGGWVMTGDLWMGPKLAATKEMADFDRRYVQKLYGSSFGADMQAMMSAMAATPAFAKAMKAFSDKRASFDGSAIRSVMTFETVGAPAGSEESASSDSDSQSAASAVIGGLFNKMQKKRQARNAEEEEKPGRSKLFDSTTEVLKATTTASAADVTIPGDFKQR